MEGPSAKACIPIEVTPGWQGGMRLPLIVINNDMRYYEFLNLTEISDKVKQQLRVRFKKEEPNLNDVQIDHYLDQWDRYSKNFPADKRDISRLRFSEIEQLVDAAAAKSELKGKAKPTQNFNTANDVVYSRDGLTILLADTKEKCIKYGAGYSYCISRKDSANLFSKYRMADTAATFYFVFDETKPKTDIWHAAVIYVLKNGKYMVAHSENTGDKEMSWEEISTHIPRLRGLERLFVNRPHTPEETDAYKRFSNPLDLASYKALSPQDQVRYIQYGNQLTDKQQDVSNDQVVAFYAKTVPSTITQRTFNRLKPGDVRYIVKQLYNRPDKMMNFSRMVMPGVAWEQTGLPDDIVKTAYLSILNYNIEQGPMQYIWENVIYTMYFRDVILNKSLANFNWDSIPIFLNLVKTLKKNGMEELEAVVTTLQKSQQKR